ncbi:MAG: terminase small subunit [Oscillibacter sp.]|nr:terminase small subunit [Oscillibacter sp.]
MRETSGGRQRKFCQAYLRTMDVERAADEAGCSDGFAQLASESVQSKLEQMREAAAGQLRREDVLRRLAQLAFGQANDGVKLALQGREAETEGMDLSAVAEIRVTDKGGVEIKFVDRVKALEALCGLLETGSSGQGAEELYQVLAAAAREEGGWEHD